MSNGIVTGNHVVGDYDVVVQFSLPAVNRFLAVMHECGRFLHSISGYINDVVRTRPQLPPIVLTGVMDAFGNAVANDRRIPRTPFSGTVAANDPVSALRGPLVNPGGVFEPPPIIPSDLSGVVQLQIFPPTVDVPDASGKKLSVSMSAMARYFPDPKTAPIAQFLRGNLQIVAPINHISSQVGNVIEFDFKADQATVAFTPTYSSNVLASADHAAINLAIRNALVTSFQPSSATLPSGISALNFKTLLSGSQKAGALLLNLTNRHGDPASVQQVILSPADDFGFAISPAYINSLFISAVKQLTNFPPVNVSEWPLSTTYNISLTSPPPALNVTTGAIEIIINAHAHTGDFGWPSFNFRTVVAFTLKLVPIDGHGRLGAAELALAKVSLDFTDSGIGGDIKDAILGAFKGPITSNIASAVNNILNSPDPKGLQATVRGMTNIDAQMGNMVNSLLNDPGTGDQPDSSLKLVFAYTAVDIQPSAIILRGSESVRAWADPYVEFDQVPSQASVGAASGQAGGVLTQNGPDYTALNTWIPGGTITQYEWSVKSQNQLYPFGVDPNKFVLLHSGPVVEADVASAVASLPPYTPLCLTVRGTRIASSGSGPAQPVSASFCGYHHLPLPVNQASGVVHGAVITLTQPGPQGHVVVTGHAAPQPAAPGTASNLLVHFADAKSAASLSVLTQALKHAKRNDTAVMAVVPSGELSKLRFTPGIIYAENDAAWQRAFGLDKASRPLTVMIVPSGKAVWHHPGELDHKTLSAALSKPLAPAANVAAKLIRLNTRSNQPAPNFLFAYGPGYQMPLAKLKGRRVVLVFWHSGSPPSIQAINDALHASNGAQPPLVLAINDGEPAERAQRAFSQAKLDAISVADPDRTIASAYGVNVWPTIVAIDASGTISSVQFGYADGGHEPAPAG